MTQEEKEILIKDLCARLLYGVKIYHIYSEKPVRFNSKHLNQIGAVKILPYLRPMSSMTEEERMEFTILFDKWHDDELFDYIEEGVEFSIWKHKGISSVVFDWLNKNMFDYRGLIPMGLALEATEDMYSTKTE